MTAFWITLLLIWNILLTISFISGAIRRQELAKVTQSRMDEIERGIVQELTSILRRNGIRS